MLDLALSTERAAYSPEKHYLGVLCKRAHDAGGGLSWRHNGHGNCVECTRESARLWKIANPERARANTAHRDARRGCRPNGERRRKWPFAVYLGDVRRRARNEGLPFNLTIDSVKSLWRKQCGKCFWTGREIDFFIGPARHPMRPSLDKIVPERGYVEGNVVWSSNFANRARGDLNAEAFAELTVSMGFPQVRLP